MTKAQAWDSWHQYSLAADVAFKTEPGKWTWEFEPKAIKDFFLDQGLEWLFPFEACHFQMTGGLSIADARAITQRSGVQTLWQIIAAK